MHIKISILSSFLALSICFLPLSSQAIVNTITYQEAYESKGITNRSFDKVDLNTLLGRKHSLKEKIILPIITKRLSKKLKVDNQTNDVKFDGIAITGFVLGILSMLGLGIIGGILGIIFSTNGLKRIRQEPQKRKGKGLARAGLVCSIVGIVAGITLLIYLISNLTIIV